MPLTPIWRAPARPARESGESLYCSRDDFLLSAFPLRARYRFLRSIEIGSERIEVEQRRRGRTRRRQRL